MTGFMSMTAEQYHADPCETPSLSASVASTLIRQSPYHAWLSHPRLGGRPRESTPEMDRGTLLHALILGTPTNVAIVPADNYRTKAAQEARDAARDAGQIPVLEREWAGYLEVADAVGQALDAAGVRLMGESEPVAVWEEPSEAGPVQCRGRLDHVTFDGDGATIFDLKTCRNAHPRSCERHVIEFGYDLQRAAYVSAISQIQPECAGRVRFVWLFVEEVESPTGKPGAVLTVAEASGTMRELGESRWRRAVETWAKCLRANEWPAYGSVRLDAPDWALRDETERADIAPATVLTL